MAPFSATILNLIFKLSSGYLLAIFDFEIHMMPRCFLLLPLLVLCKFCSCQSDNNSLFAVCCFCFCFCQEAQEIILLLKSRNFI